MYTIYVKFDCLPNKRQAFIEKVKSSGVLDAIRAEDGCIRYDYYFPIDTDNQIFLWEQWESREAQKVHCQTPHFAQLGELKLKYNATTEILIEDQVKED